MLLQVVAGNPLPEVLSGRDQPSKVEQETPHRKVGFQEKNRVLSTLGQVVGVVPRVHAPWPKFCP